MSRSKFNAARTTTAFLRTAGTIWQLPHSGQNLTRGNNSILHAWHTEKNDVEIYSIYMCTFIFIQDIQLTIWIIHFSWDIFLTVMTNSTELCPRTWHQPIGYTLPRWLRWKFSMRISPGNLQKQICDVCVAKINITAREVFYVIISGCIGKLTWMLRTIYTWK